MAKRVDPEELVGAAEICVRLGVARNTIHLWRSRSLGFPAPIIELEKALIWHWPEVEAWARNSGRAVPWTDGRTGKRTGRQE